MKKILNKIKDLLQIDMNETTKFWAETIRTIIIGIIAILFLNPLKEKNQYHAEINKEKTKVITEFIESSYWYTSHAQTEGKFDSVEYKLFKGDDYSKYRIAQHKMKLYFGKCIDKKIDSVENTSSKLKDCIDYNRGCNCEAKRKYLKQLNQRIEEEALKEVEILDKND